MSIFFFLDAISMSVGYEVVAIRLLNKMVYYFMHTSFVSPVHITIYVTFLPEVKIDGHKIVTRRQCKNMPIFSLSTFKMLETSMI